MRSKLLLCAAIVPLLFVNLVQAQDTRGTILGRVTDSTGANVAGRRSQGHQRRHRSGGEPPRPMIPGTIPCPSWLPGMYNVTAELAGFKKFVRENVQVRVNDTVEVNMQLTVGDVAESVEVTADTPLLSTAEASLGQVVDERRVLELPLFSRQRHGV